MAEGTVLEALTAELLGDVGVLHDQVKALRDVLPNVANQFMAKIEVQTGNNLAAAAKLGEVLVNISQQFDDNVEKTTARFNKDMDKSTVAAVESARTLAKLDIVEAAMAAAKVSVQEIVGAEVAKVVSQVSVAGANFSKEVKAARIEIQNAEKHVNWSVAKYVGVIFSAVLLASVITTATQIYLVPKIGSIAGISEDDKKFVQAGKDITFVYNKLTDAERNRISKILAQRQ